MRQSQLNGEALKDDGVAASCSTGDPDQLVKK